MENAREKKPEHLSIYPATPKLVEYEVRTLPLQNEIGIIRVNATQQCTIVKEQWMIMKQKCSTALASHTGLLSTYGITKDSLVVQAGTVGGAMLLGYLFARKKSVFKQVLYPSAGGAVVGGAFYFSSSANRKHSKDWLLRCKELLWPK